MFKQIILFVLLLSVVRTDDAAMKACTADADCKDAAFPFCNLQYRDSTKTPNVFTGVCAQCRDDCDCGVNQYCASHVQVTKSTLKPSKGDNIYGNAYQGLTTQGVCRPFGQSDTERKQNGLGQNGASALNQKCKTSNQFSTQFTKSPSGSDGCKDQFTSGWTVDQFKSATAPTYYCGALAAQFNSDTSDNWAGGLNKGEVKNVAAAGSIPDNTGNTALSCNTFKKANVCPFNVYVEGNKQFTGGCQESVVVTDNGTPKTTLTASGSQTQAGTFVLGDSLGQAVARTYDWKGFCQGSGAVGFGTCKVCRSGDTRCTANSMGMRGVPQICIGGNWVAKTGGPLKGGSFISTDSNLLGGDLTNGLLATILAFIVIVFMVMCVCGLISAYKKKKEAEAKGETVTFRTFVMSPAK